LVNRPACVAANGSPSSRTQPLALPSRLAALEVWPDMIHVWQMFGDVLPEAVDAIAAIRDFVRAHCERRPASAPL